MEGILFPLRAVPSPPGGAGDSLAEVLGSSAGNIFADAVNNSNITSLVRRLPLSLRCVVATCIIRILLISSAKAFDNSYDGIVGSQGGNKRR